MVEVKREVRRRKRSTSSSGSSSGSSSSSSTSSGSESSSESSTTRSPTPKKANTRGRDDRDRRRASPAHGGRSRSPARRAAVSSSRPEKTTVSSSRRSPSPVRRRSPERRRRSRSPPPARRSRSPVRRRSPRREDTKVVEKREVEKREVEKREEKREEPVRRICVRNLSRNVTKEHLLEIFGLFGSLKSCELPADRVHTYLSRGYGYVEYEKPEDAEKAMKHMDGGQIDGLEIKCEMTLPYKSGSGRERSPRDRSPPRRERREPSPLMHRGGRDRRTPPRGTGSNSIPLGGRRSRSPRR